MFRAGGEGVSDMAVVIDGPVRSVLSLTLCVSDTRVSSELRSSIDGLIPISPVSPVYRGEKRGQSNESLHIGNDRRERGKKRA